MASAATDGASAASASASASGKSAVDAAKALLESLMRERGEISRGVHARVLERLAVVEGAKAAELAEAVRQRQRAVDAAEALYKYNVYAAGQVCEENKKKALELLMQEVDERLRQAADAPVLRDAGIHVVLPAAVLASGGDGAAAGMKGEGGRRKLRSKKNEGKDEAGGAATAPGGDGDKAAGPLMAGAYIMLGLEGMPPPPLQVQLPAQDVMHDLKTIYKDWKAAAMRWRLQAGVTMIPARVERGKLYYGSETYTKGEQVTIFSELTKQEFFGTMHVLSATEVIVRLVDGTKARVPLQHLRHGRASLYRYNGAAGYDGADGEGDVPPVRGAKHAAREKVRAVAAAEENVGRARAPVAHRPVASAAHVGEDVEMRRKVTAPHARGMPAAAAAAAAPHESMMPPPPQPQGTAVPMQMQAMMQGAQPAYGVIHGDPWQHSRIAYSRMGEGGPVGEQVILAPMSGGVPMMAAYQQPMQLAYAGHVGDAGMQYEGHVLATDGAGGQHLVPMGHLMHMPMQVQMQMQGMQLQQMPQMHMQMVPSAGMEQYMMHAGGGQMPPASAAHTMQHTMQQQAGPTIVTETIASAAHAEAMEHAMVEQQMQAAAEAAAMQSHQQPPPPPAEEAMNQADAPAATDGTEMGADVPL